MMKRFFGIFFTLLAVCCCETKPEQEEAAPEIVSTTPENGAGGLTALYMDVVFTYDQVITCQEEAKKGVTVDGGATVDKVDANGRNLTVSVSGLSRGKSYTVRLPEGLVKGYKQNQKSAAAASLSFSLKESTDIVSKS